VRRFPKPDKNGVVTLSSSLWASHFLQAVNELRQQKLNKEKELIARLRKVLFPVVKSVPRHLMTGLRKDSILPSRIITLHYKRSPSKIITLHYKRSPSKIITLQYKRSVRRCRDSERLLVTPRRLFVPKIEKSQPVEEAPLKAGPPSLEMDTSIEIEHTGDVDSSEYSYVDELVPSQLSETVSPSRSPTEEETFYDAGEVQLSPWHYCFRWDMQCIKTEGQETCFACWRRSKPCGGVTALGKWVENNGRLVDPHFLFQC
jgi:hypothetical protein